MPDARRLGRSLNQLKNHLLTLTPLPLVSRQVAVPSLELHLPSSIVQMERFYH